MVGRRRDAAPLRRRQRPCLGVRRGSARPRDAVRHSRAIVVVGHRAGRRDRRQPRIRRARRGLLARRPRPTPRRLMERPIHPAASKTRTLLVAAALPLVALAAACGAEPTPTPATPTPTPAPTATATRAPTPTPLPPTATATLAPTATPAPQPTATPTRAPTPAPRSVRREAVPARPAPTATSTIAPTATPIPPPTPTATPTIAPTATPTPQPTATPTPAPSAGWRGDVPVGANAGDRAADATLTLADGSSATIAEAAGGRSVLLYFFATW